jgi:hypothetical protein
MAQQRIERPQEKKPRPPDQSGNIGNDLDIGDTDDILKELDIIEHPEKYTQEQRDCTCLRPPKKGGFR